MNAIVAAKQIDLSLLRPLFQIHRTEFFRHAIPSADDSCKNRVGARIVTVIRLFSLT